MEFNYTIYNPTTSKIAQEILNTPVSTLVNKYIKKKSAKPVKFFDAVREEINRVDDEEYLINPYMYSIAGSNLNYVANQVFILASKLNKLGYEFKIENVIRDFDRLFSEYSNEVDKINKESKVQPISREIAHFFVDEVLNDKLVVALEKSLNKTSNNNI